MVDKPNRGTSVPPPRSGQLCADEGAQLLPEGRLAEALGIGSAGGWGDGPGPLLELGHRLADGACGLLVEEQACGRLAGRMGSVEAAHGF